MESSSGYQLVRDQAFPSLFIIKTSDSERWLTRLRSEGTLKNRNNLVVLLIKMYKAMFRCLRKEVPPFINVEKVEIILVLRDAIVAFEPAILEFPGAHIGLIGHERNTEVIPPRTTISFKRYENPSDFEVVIVIDLMVASGETLSKVLDTLSTPKKPSVLFVACILISPEAELRLRDKVTRIYAFSLEKGLIDGAWLSPGLRGIKDVGDLIFNTKLDWKANS